MKKVIDKNIYEAPEFARYLANTENMAVMPDYAFMESYTGNSVLNLHRTIQILSKHPTQIIALRSTTELCGMKPKLKGLQKRFAYRDGAKQFSLFFTEVEAAAAGSRMHMAALEARGLEAKAHLERMRKDAALVCEGILQYAERYRRKTYRDLLTGDVSSDELRMISKDVLLITAGLFHNHPRAGRPPQQASDLRNTYLFRNALVGFLMALRWIDKGISRGSVPKLEVLRNDVVDSHYITCATFYGGLLTADEKMMELYGLTQLLLDHYFV